MRQLGAIPDLLDGLCSAVPVDALNAFAIAPEEEGGDGAAAGDRRLFKAAGPGHPWRLATPRCSRGADAARPGRRRRCYECR
jgi:hypothetical protein